MYPAVQYPCSTVHPPSRHPAPSPPSSPSSRLSQELADSRDRVGELREKLRAAQAEIAQLRDVQASSSSGRLPVLSTVPCSPSAVPCSLFLVRGSLVCAAQLQPRSGRPSAVEAERAEKSPRPAASPSPCLRRRSCERGRSMPGGLGQGLGRGESIAEAGEATRVRSRVSVWFCVCLYGIERLPRTDRAIARGEAPLPRYRATCPALPCCCMMHDDSYVMLCCAVRAGRRFSAEGALVRDGPADLAVRLPRGSAAGHGRREMQVLLSPPA